MSLAVFPFVESRPPLGNVELLIEQSFSDFGDSDALALVTAEGDRRSAVFLEAKVKTYHVTNWRIVDEFNLFRLGLDRQMNSSNLFCQLYFKYRLVGGLRAGGMPALQAGLDFLDWSSKQNRRIGTNGVVLEAARKLEPFAVDPYYLALVPDSRSNVAEFFDTTLGTWPHPGVPDWNSTRFGYLTWQDVKTFCEREGLVRTLDTLRFNAGQISAYEAGGEDL